jgi:hypothetical protein
MYNSTIIPGDLVSIKQSSWYTNVNTWTLELTKKCLRGVFLGRLKEENKSFHDYPNPVRVVINGCEEIVVDLSKINYYNKRRSYEKIN